MENEENSQTPSTEPSPEDTHIMENEDVKKETLLEESESDTIRVADEQIQQIGEQIPVGETNASVSLETSAPAMEKTSDESGAAPSESLSSNEEQTEDAPSLADTVAASEPAANSQDDIESKPAADTADLSKPSEEVQGLSEEKKLEYYYLPEKKLAKLPGTILYEVFPNRFDNRLSETQRTGVTPKQSQEYLDELKCALCGVPGGKCDCKLEDNIMDIIPHQKIRWMRES